MTIVSIQGLAGSYSHLAAQNVFESFELNCQADFSSTFAALQQGKSKYAVIPIENSTVGSITQNFTLLSEHGFQVIKEVVVRVNFHLAAKVGTTLADIQEIYSHPAGLGQIQKFLTTLPRVKAVEYFDTAGAAEMVAKSEDQFKAAACSRLAAEIYGLEILRENIHDNPQNFTRFFVLAKDAVDRDSHLQTKTSLQFELSHKSGSLVEFLECFSRSGISLTKIESRPLPNVEWEYRFYIDVDAGISEKRMKTALTLAQTKCHNLRVLGSYAKGSVIPS